MGIRDDADRMIRAAIASAMPGDAVRRALLTCALPERVHVLAIGKAAWEMAAAAHDVLGNRIADGVVITKYGHARGGIGAMRVYEAGHPVPDANGVAATEQALALARGLGREDVLVFLVSGGGSALFERPLVSLSELADVNRQLLASGADIREINTVRKRLSAVKGGRFAGICAPARVVSVILSDVIGDPLDLIASGPACADPSTCRDALAVAEKYGLTLSDEAWRCLSQETPKSADNAEALVTGNVGTLCESAAAAARELGYEPVILTASLTCQAREAGSFLAAIAQRYAPGSRSMAFIAGGETVVRVTGSGLGGRNQELALAAAEGIAGLGGVCVFSVGSDGTDGPTDAAGGYVDGQTRDALLSLGLTVSDVLRDNDSYHALQACGGLIVTGPTGTNVNDVCALLIRR